MGIVKDLKALFSKSYLGTRESDEILLDLKSELSNSHNLSLILEELSSYTYKGKIKELWGLFLKESLKEKQLKMFL